MLVKPNRTVSTSNVILDVYKVNDGKEIFDNTIRISVDPAITWFYKEVAFYKEGDFIVYVYDERDQLLGAGKVKVSFFN